MNTPIQRILVPLDPSEYSQAATKRACEVAKAHFAQIEGLLILDTPEIRSFVTPLEMQNWPAIAEAMSIAFEQNREEMEDVRKRFEETCEALHAPHLEVQMEGLPPKLILEASALSDLIVVGVRTFFQFEHREGPGDSLAKILDRTVTPVLAVPNSEPVPIKKVVIAFDGSLNASRALRDFVGFAKPYDFEITIFSAGEDKAHATKMAGRAVAYLRAHGIETFQTQIGGKDEMESFRQERTDPVDLVVAGIHSRKFFRDAFVGSFTNQLIEAGTTSLFLSH